MTRCKTCGSYAINPHQNGRGGDNLDLCDVCYWRARFDALREAVGTTRRLEKKLESECDDETEWKTVYCQLHHVRAEVDKLLEEK